MAIHNESVEKFLAEGCGRCEHFQTPQCKVHDWAGALVELRALLRTSGLEETMKWGSPCYTLEGKNVAMLVAYRDWCGISFFQGALLPDEDGLLVAPGPNSRHARGLRFTSVTQVRRRKKQVRSYLDTAIEVRRSGARVEPRRETDELPEALQAILDEDADVRTAWEALTPGRRRSHILHVSGAKQAKTRVSRAHKCATRILAGKGFNER